MNATTTPAAASAPAPDSIKYSYWALLTAAAFAFISPLVLLGQRGWLESTQRKAGAKEKPPVVHSDADWHRLATDSMREQIIFGIISAVILAFVAIHLYRGSRRARFVLFGLFVLMAIGGFSLIGIFSIINIGSSEPVALKIPTFIGALAYLASVILASLKTSSAYVNRNRPARPARVAAAGGAQGTRGAAAGARPGLLGTLFAPRPPATKTGPTSSSGPSATRSTGEPMRRGKAKARSASDAVPPAPAPAPAKTSLKKQAKAKGR